MEKEWIEKIDKLKEWLKKPNLNVVIIPHISPDGDAVGSCSALAQVLQKTGVNSHIITCDYIPEYLRFLKQIPEAISYQDRGGLCKRLIADADLIFMLDHNTVKREGDLQELVATAKAERVVIDHHLEPEAYSLVISDTTVSSTCELLYRVILAVWSKEIIDSDIANSLYTGINTDTGGLSHNSSRPDTYRIIADLLELGLNKGYIHEQIYQNNRISRLRLIGNTLLNKLQLDENYPVAVMVITQEELERYDYQDGDLEGLVNVPLSIQHILVSIQITERKEKVKLSFRSKGNVPVNEWAKNWFSGGGHLNAAGGQMEHPLEKVIQKVQETTPLFFEQFGAKQENLV